MLKVQKEKAMDGPTLDRLARFTTVGLAEKINLRKALGSPLSGYLGGINKAGYFVSKLQDSFCDKFSVKHAIACNSATSGLLAACMAIGIKPGDTVWTSAYTMSATAACAKVLGANIVFIDIETQRYSMNMNQFRQPFPKCIIVTNLFGHPAYLASMRSWCDSNKVWMIEDNAQSPFATEGSRYAGTIGHIGVFSFNVHKHIQCGEGGVICTNDAALAGAISDAINHGELSSGNRIGLNLRMTEPTAAIACAQFAKASAAISSRVGLALALTEMVDGIPWIEPPTQADGCRHVYYVWAAKVFNKRRDALVRRLNESNFPMRVGYSPTLNRVFGVDQPCPEAERMEDSLLMTFEVCAYDPKKRQIRRMTEIMKWAAHGVSREIR